MNQSDCTIISIEEGVECPLCYNSVSIDDIVNTCNKNIHHHNVCKDCVKNLKKNGFQKGCLYCGDPYENNIIVVTSNAITRSTEHMINNTNPIVIFQPNRDSYVLFFNRESFCGIVSYTIIVIIMFFIIYTFGVILYYLTEMIDYWLKNKDHTDKEIDFSLRNCVLGYIIFGICIYLMVQCLLLIQLTIEKCLIPCFKKIRPTACRY